MHNVAEAFDVLYQPRTEAAELIASCFDFCQSHAETPLFLHCYRDYRIATDVVMPHACLRKEEQNGPHRVLQSLGKSPDHMQPMNTLKWASLGPKFLIHIPLQDIGFDGISPLIGTDDNVVNMYWNSYFPKAVSGISRAPPA